MGRRTTFGLLLWCALASATAANDLVVASLSASPATIALGSGVSVTDTVTVVDGSTSATTYVYYYLSADAAITAGDTKIGSRVVPTLAAGQSSSATTALTLPTTVTGTYYVGAIADATEKIPESDETNNALAGNVVTITRPDLVVSSLSATPETIPLGSGVTVTDTVTVTGGKTLSATGATASFYVHYYLSIDPVITTADTKIGSRSIPALNPGQSSSATTALTLPTTATGTYYVGAIADGTGLVPESDETNNALAGTVVTITKPDLVVSSLSATPETIPLGSGVTVTDTVTVTGGKTLSATGATASFYVHYYLSVDPVITTADTKIGSRSIPALNPGQSSSATTALTLPTTATGTYYVGAIADGTGVVPESDETNNALAGNVVTITKPDLVVASLSATPATIPLGSGVTVTDTVTVTGGKTLSASGATTSFYVHYYLSTDPVITTADTNVDSRYVPALNAGQSNSATTLLTLPTTVTGTYYVGAIVDATEKIPESDETNNAFTGNAVTITKPDLVVATLSATPATIPLGSGVTVTDTVTVTGGKTLSATGATTSSYVHYFLSTDPVITTADTNVDSRYVPALNTGQSNSATTLLTLPTTVTGTYYVGAIVDATEKIPESDETNNALAGNVVTITKPDLVVASLSATPATISLGSGVTVTDTVTVTDGKTLSATGATTSFYVHYYLSVDPVITTADTNIGSRSLPVLNPGESSSATTALTLPTTVTGTYYVGAIVDATEKIPESDETNNAFTGNVVTITKPDLVVTSLNATPETIPLGSGVTVTDTVTVTGGKTLSASGATVSYHYVHYYLSTDPVITAADTKIGSRAVTTLGPGQSSSATTALTLPTTVPGTYYVGAIVDATGVVPESDETNNALASNRVQIVRDTAPATIAVTGITDGQITNELPLTVCYTVTDPELASAEGNLDGVPFQGCAIAYQTGEHLLTVTTADTLGNVLSQEWRFTIDRVAPALSIEAPAPASIFGAAAALVVAAASDDVELATITVNGSELDLRSDGRWQGVALLAEGTNSIVVVATDRAGNSAQAILEVLRDTTPPVLEVASPAEGAVVGVEVTVSGHVEDTTAVTVTVNALAATVDAGGNFSRSVPVEPGQQQLSVVATDAAGNSSTTTRNIADGASTRYCYDGAGNMVGRIAALPGASCGAP